jgi:Integrase core domain
VFLRLNTRYKLLVPTSRGQRPPHRRGVYKALDVAALERMVHHEGERLIESFNGRLRGEFLNVNEFDTMQDRRERLKAWPHDHDLHRPHASLGSLTPGEFVRKRSDQQVGSCPTPG